MKIFIKHIFRNIKEHLGRTLIIFFSLFCISCIISISLVLYFVIDAFADTFSNTVFFDFYVTSTNDEELSKNRISSIGYDFDLLGATDSNYGYVKKDDKYVSTPLIGLNIRDAQKLKMVDIDELKNNEVIIFKAIANKLGLKDGDTFTYIDEDKKEYSFNIKIVLDDDDFLFQNTALISNEETYKKITGENDNKYTIFFAKYNGKEKVNNVEKKLYSIEDDLGLNFFRIDYIDIFKEFSNTIGLLGVAFLLIIVIIFFSINSIVKIIINDRIPIIGTFRSVGASTKKMNLILLLEMSIYGILAGIAGSLLGLGLMKLLFSGSEMLLGIEVSSSTITSKFILIVAITITFLILFQILLSIFEIMKSNKLSIKECIYDKHNNSYKYSSLKLLIGVGSLIIVIISSIFAYKLNYIFAFISILSFFISIAFLLPFITRFITKFLYKSDSPVIKMANSNVNNNRLQISSGIIIAIMFTVCLIVFSILNYYIENINDSYDIVQSDIYVETYSYNNTEKNLLLLDNVSKLGGVYYSEINSLYNDLSFANNKVRKATIIYSNNPKNLLDLSNIVDVDVELWANLKDDEVILSNYYKDKYNLKVNDIITLNGYYESKYYNIDVPFNLKIVGFANTNNISDIGIITNINTYSKISSDALCSIESKFYINVNEKKNIPSVKKNINKLLKNDIIFNDTKEQYIEYQKLSKKTMYRLIAIVTACIIGIGLSGIINNQNVSFIERKKEFAILYSTSMSRKQINNLIVEELLISNISSMLISFIFFTILIYLLNKIILLLEYYIPIKLSISSLIILIIAMLIILLIIYLVMKKKIRKMNIVEEIKYE